MAGAHPHLEFGGPDACARYVSIVPDVTDELMTVAEVTAILKLKQQTSRNWIDPGSLPALRPGGCGSEGLTSAVEAALGAR